MLGSAGSSGMDRRFGVTAGKAEALPHKVIEFEVEQARNGKAEGFFGGYLYVGKVRCPKCRCDGYLHLLRQGSFQVSHYVGKTYSLTSKSGRKDIYRYCTLWSLGKLMFHAHRCLGIGIPLWSNDKVAQHTVC